MICKQCELPKPVIEFELVPTKTGKKYRRCKCRACHSLNSRKAYVKRCKATKRGRYATKNKPYTPRKEPIRHYDKLELLAYRGARATREMIYKNLAARMAA